MLIDLIAGARPNFIKIAPIISAIENKQKKGFKIKYRLIHTGQHYDNAMSNSFFKQLNIPKPDVNLGAGGGNQSEQTAKIMIGYENILKIKVCDLCLVVGDVTSTMACSIVAKKFNIKVAHVEAGIRSGDLSMPEEINRIVTDSITDYFFTTSIFANKNLYKIGINKERIFFVGNTMIDTLYKFKNKLIKPIIWDNANLQNRNFIILTLHRPSNVDDKKNLRLILNTLLKCTKDIKIIFPVHPRTKNILTNLSIKNKNIFFIDPLSYLEFNYLVSNSLAVLTDSGGITEETTVMGIPCMTLRDSTERPETITIGTNVLLGTNPETIKVAFKTLQEGKWKKGKIPIYWDGKTSMRIIDILYKAHINQN
jgi:UDP-N-acetylglucosamine 2-epimerase (non-hydrolysing)